MTKTEKTIPSIEYKEEKRSTVDPDCGWFRKHLFCQHEPSLPVLKDAGRKTRDFFGFSSFFTVFLTFLKFGF